MVKCPTCGINGSAQIRGNSVRVGHYVGYKGDTRIVNWHCTTLEDLSKLNNCLKINMVNNNGHKMVNNEQLSIDYHAPQTHNLENINGGQTLLSRSRGLEARKKRESRSRHHLFLMLMPNFCGEFRQQIVGYPSG